MAVILQKGDRITLLQEVPGLETVTVILGWELRDNAEFDLDASCFLLGSDNKVRQNADFIFYGHLDSTCGSVKHSGDHRGGSGNERYGEEKIDVNLQQIPADVAKLLFTVTMSKEGEMFGMLSSAYIRLLDSATSEEIARFDLAEDASVNNALAFGEIYRRQGGEWKFRAIGQGVRGGLRGLCCGLGVRV